MSEIYDIDLILELTIGVSADSLEEAEGKVEELSDAKLIEFVQAQLPYMDNEGCSTSAH